MLAREGVCAAPKSMGFAPFWSENGYKLLPDLVWIRVWFSRELRKYMKYIFWSEIGSGLGEQGGTPHDHQEFNEYPPGCHQS